MITRITKAHPSLRIFVFLSMILVLLPAFALSEETYKFERMWPVSQLPWNFHHPEEIAIGSTGNVYVVDAGNYRIQKFGPDGTFITRWGTQGAGDGEFSGPRGIAIDGSDNVYVVDTGNNRIQRFDSDGKFIGKWGTYGESNGDFNSPTGIAISNDGNVYVADTWNYRIQKFNNEGVFLAKWGKQGSEDGSFSIVENWIYQGVAVDNTGNVYVVDNGNYRVQKFTPEGAFVSKWGGFGEENGEFNCPDRIVIDDANNIFVLDHNNYTGSNCIQKFNPDGSFISSLEIGGVGDRRCTFCNGMAVNGKNIYVSDDYSGRIQKISDDGTLIFKWGTDGSGDGEFFKPAGIAMDSSGNVYVADSLNHRIQKFSSEGQFLKKWGSFGSENGQFNWPEGIAVDKSNNIYVADLDNHRIQKFDSNGVFLDKWGSYGTGNGEFNLPVGIAVDILGNVYVSEVGNSRIQKFSPNGEFITKWGSPGSGNGQFSFFIDIAVSDTGYIYILDSGNNRIQKFGLDGAYVTQWGTPGSSDGEFTFTGEQPGGITVDGSGNVYVVDAGNYRVQKFTGSGEFITKFGAYGYGQGELIRPSYICVGLSGRVYVSDFGTNSIQVFSKEGPPVSGTSKAIIVAGGGPYAGNNLWDATEMNANHAYRALTYQGYSKENLYYLSADTDLDLDGNGKLDDVDADATNANLQYAIKTWALDAEDLFIYMVDHGGNGTFRMSGTELLYATNLDAWLDTIQETLLGCVTMVYDACESGSFLPYLLPPAGKQRILATSTSSGEESIFVGNGTVSFSFLFWGHMFNGDSFYDAFVNAKQSVSTTYNQTSQLDGDGNGIGNEKADKDLASLIRIGNETRSAGDVPVIGGVSPAQTLETATSAVIYADQVIDADGISRVWAVITPPGYSSGDSGTPVTDLPMIDLNSVGNNRYEATYTNFNSSGTYNIAIFAMDRKGVLSLPLQTSVTTTSSCLAVGAGLGIQVPCAEYNGNRYGFLLDFYRHPDDPAGYYWKLIMGTLTTGEAGDCLSIGTDLSMPMPCVSYNGTQYGFALRFFDNSYDPSGLYWKMDMSTLEVK